MLNSDWVCLWSGTIYFGRFVQLRDVHLYAGLGLLAATSAESQRWNRFCPVASFSVFPVIQRISSKANRLGC